MKIPKLYLATLFSIKNSYYYSITKNINEIIQIKGLYSALHYDKNDDPLRYGTKARKKIKYSYHKKGLIEDHHLIPKEFHEHSLFENIHFDVGCSNNIYILPSISYKESIYNNNLNKDEIIYHTSHRLYNNFIKEKLNNIYKIENIDEQKYEFLLFLNYLRLSFDNNDVYIKSLFLDT
tara:strand:+ start:69 stop:602 length:534 start_codon:yes stop_codon:yes gene_type:complete